VEKAHLNLCGDRLEVHWDGNVWRAPSCGTQYARVFDAMRDELELYLSASGENVDEMETEIRALLDRITFEAEGGAA